MIPKVIHYCWFGKNKKSASVQKCIASWRKYCPDYEIIEWNEENFPLKENLYCYQAYRAEKWAFAADYARLWIVYNYGGIYLDTDVEILKNWDPLLLHDCFMGRQASSEVNTGVGFGAVKGHPLIKIMLDDYQSISFIKEDGEMDLWTCPHRNSQWLYENGMEHKDVYQEIAGAAIYPSEFFSPKDAWTRQTKRTKNTYSIHHCDGTWNLNETRKSHTKRFAASFSRDAKHYILHIPNQIMQSIVGKKNYEKLKRKIRSLRK